MRGKVCPLCSLDMNASVEVGEIRLGPLMLGSNAVNSISQPPSDRLLSSLETYLLPLRDHTTCCRSSSLRPGGDEAPCYAVVKDMRNMSLGPICDLGARKVPTGGVFPGFTITGSGNNYTN